MINAPIEYKRSRANHSTGRSYSILTWVAVIDEPTQLTARLTLYDLIDMVTELGLEPPQITVLMGPAKVDDVMSTSALKVPHSLERPTSSPTFALASARSRVLRNWGKATADNRPIIATTIMSSTRVKPCLIRPWRFLSCWRSWSWVAVFMSCKNAACMPLILAQSPKTVKP